MYHRPNIISKPLHCARRASYTYEVRKVKLATSTNCAIYLYVTHSTAAVGREKVGKGQKESQYAGKRNLRKRIYQLFFLLSLHRTLPVLFAFSAKGQYSGHNIPAIILPKSAIPVPNQLEKAHRYLIKSKTLRSGGPGH